MIQRNTEHKDDRLMEEQGKDGRSLQKSTVAVSFEHNDKGTAAARNNGVGSTAANNGGITQTMTSFDDDTTFDHGQTGATSVAPHKKLNTIKTTIEEDDDDSKHLLSDEDLAWKLHQELNAGSPVFRTRSQRGGSKGRSSLAEPALRGNTAKERKVTADNEETTSKKIKKENKRKRGARHGTGDGEDMRRSPRGIASGKELDDSAANQESGHKGSGKARSRKGKPRVAAEGGDGNHRDGPARRTKKVLPKIPKLPMVRQGVHWYRARVLKEDKQRILVEFAGYEHSLPSTWLPKYCDRVWLGSYKGKDWRYQGDGAWVPKKGIINRIINAEEYGISAESVEDSEQPITAHESIGGAGKTPTVGTPNLLSDVASMDADDAPPMRKRKAQASGKESNESASRKARSRKKVFSQHNDGKSKQYSSKSGNDCAKDDSDEIARRERPKRHTKPTKLLNSTDFAVDAEVDMMDSDLNNGLVDAAGALVTHSRVLSANGFLNGSKSDSNRYFNDCLNSLDEQEALAALAEMPASPASFPGLVDAEAMLENSREALLEAYTNRKKSSQNGKKTTRKQWKRPYKSEPDLHRSQTAESISTAQRMFGGLLHAVSSRIGNGIQRSISMPIATTQSPKTCAWSPHIWSSGVSPADGEPAIVQVPKSLIQKALLSPKYMVENSKRPPVPLFY